MGQHVNSEGVVGSTSKGEHGSQGSIRAPSSMPNLENFLSRMVKWRNAESFRHYFRTNQVGDAKI